MTVLFFSRHFDQVKRVEKSPKAKQYLVIQRAWKTRRISWKGYPLRRSSTTPLPSFYPLYSPSASFSLCTRFPFLQGLLSSILNAPFCPQRSSLIYSLRRFKLHDFAIWLHLINLVCSNDTTFLLHSFCLIFPNGSPNVLSIYPLSPQSNSPILFLISSPSLHPSFLSPLIFYLFSFNLSLL